MKTIKYLLLLLVTAVSFSSCIMHERVVPYRSYRAPGHYGYGYYHNRRHLHGYDR